MWESLAQDLYNLGAGMVLLTYLGGLGLIISIGFILEWEVLRFIYQFIRNSIQEQRNKTKNKR